MKQVGSARAEQVGEEAGQNNSGNACDSVGSACNKGSERRDGKIMVKI